MTTTTTTPRRMGVLSGGGGGDNGVGVASPSPRGGGGGGTRRGMAPGVSGTTMPLLRPLLLLLVAVGAMLALTGRGGGIGIGGGGGMRGGVRQEAAESSPSPSSSLSEPGMDFWWMAALRSNPDTLVSLSSATTTTTTSLQQQQQQQDPSRPRPRRLLAFPSETKRVWIDVGVNKKSDFLVNLDESDGSGRDLFVVGYEPSAVWKPCPHNRCAVLWAAATPTYDVIEVNVQDGADLCNSLFKPNPNTSSQLWRGCVTQQTTKDGKPMTVQAPGVPLSEVVSRIPAGVTIEYVKIDAQGYDLEVMKGALSVSDRIQVVSLEAMDVHDRTKLLYEGQPTLDDIKAFLKKSGWTFVRSVGNRGALGEVNAFFVYKDEYAAKVGRLADVLMQNKEGKGEST